MVGVECKPLTIDNDGLITAVDLINWFSACEQEFTKWEFNYQRKLPDNIKIIAVGEAIPNEGATKHIYEWYMNESIEKPSESFQEFQADLYKEALGEGWALNLLREYHTFRQDDKTVHDYWEKNESLAKSILTIGPPIPALTAMERKSHLLFGANPGIIAQILKNDIPNHQRFFLITKDEIVRLLEKYKDSISQPTTPTPTRPTTPTGIKPGPIYQTDMIAGGSPGSPETNYWNSLLKGPWDGAARLNRLVIYGDASYIFGLEVHYPSVTAMGMVNGTEPYSKLDFSLQSGTYLKSAKFGMTSGFVNAVILVENYGAEHKFGTSTIWSELQMAPDGWGIVGFHCYFTGASFSTTVGYRQRLTGIGCIYARI